MNTPRPSPSDIQLHLYESFLQASTYDVALRISGTWNAIYKLHRVVLIQAGFFRSLFTGGFSESITAIGVPPSTDEITIVFDDQNITRPAFEICISRLYGGGPTLHVSSNLIPTTVYPLTPPFSGVNHPDHISPAMHPATPRFLMSLLATAIYLSIPSVASHALSLILKTIGPTTVLQYLDFACGKGLDSYTHQKLDEFKAPVGLENVAQILEEGLPGTASPSADQFRNRSFSGKTIPEDVHIPSSSNRNSPEPLAYKLEGSKPETPCHYYGPVSDKIGESCACWLTRWATDILQLELGESSHSRGYPDSRMRSKSLSNVDANRNPLSSEFLSSTHIDKPVIWCRKGLNAKWISVIVSSDTLFVPSERQRYNFACSVVELRRREGIVEDEERIWTKMFENGIYYTNMTFDDMLFISQDISPTTKANYVPLSILQSSHWTQSMFQHLVTHKSIHLTPDLVDGVSTSSRNKDLGIATTTAEILAKIYGADQDSITLDEKSRSYFPVLSDSSFRIGANLAELSTSMEDLFNSSRGHMPTDGSGLHSGKSGKTPTTERNFFGILTHVFTGQDCVASDSSGKSLWTPFPPCRFGVEFWDVDFLKEKYRLYSQTIWYAGSLFNVYVQIVLKKGQAQLGIYLHRQSNVDTIPASSAPSISSQTQRLKDTASASIDIPTRHRQPSLPTPGSSNFANYSPSISPRSRSSTPSTNLNRTTTSSSPSLSSPTSPISGAVPSTLLHAAPQQPYRDPRSSVTAYFSISCASATGSSQTRFSSSPDNFAVSQSWGWKSNTLMAEEFVEVGSQVLPMRNEEVSMRATILVGLI